MPFEKGQSGNPGGRPKSQPFRTALDMEIKAAGEDHQVLRGIAAKLVEAAQGGDLQAITAVADRLDGKPVRTIALSLTKPLSDMNASEAFSAIADCVSYGEITTQEAQQLAGLVEARVKAIELLELENRLKALETKV